MSGELWLTSKTKWIHDDLCDIERQLHKQNELIEEALKMFKCIDLDGDKQGGLNLSKESLAKLEEIREILGVKTNLEVIDMLIDDKVEYFREYLKEK